MAESKKNCFVAMGFGKKTDYQSGRILDLDKSYHYIIKPAAEAAGLDCKRSDEISHSGLIDIPMYDQLLTADVVIVDISTSNANAFYELGVRHALRPGTTITIAEDKMVFPFDVSHLAIRKYHHLGEGIDFGEVVRMKTELTEAIQSVLKNPQKDSPVYTFFADLEPPIRKQIGQSVARSAPSFLAEAGYGLGMGAHVLDLSGILSLDQTGNRISISDPMMRDIAVAGHVAVNLHKGNFSVLADILTFDKGFWSLMVVLLEHFGIPDALLSEAITSCNDAMQLRLLVKLCGLLKKAQCAEALCIVCLRDLKDLKRVFRELREDAVTPLHRVLKTALSEMPPEALPVIQGYALTAKARKMWPQKRIFESAVSSIRRRIELKLVSGV
jgi:hypothetical protein